MTRILVKDMLPVATYQAMLVEVRRISIPPPEEGLEYEGGISMKLDLREIQPSYEETIKQPKKQIVVEMDRFDLNRILENVESTG